MKRYLGLLPPILLLSGLLTFCLWTGQRVGADAERWRAPLLQSSEAALLGDWDAAEDLLSASYEDWQSRQLFLHIVVQHEVVEDAEAMYRRRRPFWTGRRQRSTAPSWRISSTSCWPCRSRRSSAGATCCR